MQQQDICFVWSYIWHINKWDIISIHFHNIQQSTLSRYLWHDQWWLPLCHINNMVGRRMLRERNGSLDCFQNSWLSEFLFWKRILFWYSCTCISVVNVIHQGLFLIIGKQVRIVPPLYAKNSFTNGQERPGSTVLHSVTSDSGSVPLPVAHDNIQMDQYVTILLQAPDTTEQHRIVPTHIHW